MITEEKLEELPSRERIIRDSHGQDRTNYPFRKIYNWLHAQVGRPLYQITSDWVRLDWLPKQYRTYSHLCKQIEVNTFIEKGEVYYYARFGYYVFTSGPKLVKGEFLELLYIHPESELLMLHKPSKIKRVKKPETMRVLGDYHQLLKIKGIWFEVRAKENCPTILVTKVTKKDLGAKDRLISQEGENLIPITQSLSVIFKKQLSKEELKKYNLINS